MLAGGHFCFDPNGENVGKAENQWKKRVSTDMQSLGLSRAAPQIASNAPLIALVAVIITAATAFMMVTQTKFTGDITDNLANDSENLSQFHCGWRPIFAPFLKMNCC